MKNIIFILSLLALNLNAGSEQVVGPMMAGNLKMAVNQSAVAQNGGGGDYTPKVRKLEVQLVKLGHCDNKLTIEAYFFGKDAINNRIVLNSRHSAEVEATGGDGKRIQFVSTPFLIAKRPKPGQGMYATATSAAPSENIGTKPYGWLVRVYQGGRLVSETSSLKINEEWL